MIERHKKHHDTPLLLFQLLQPITLHISLETSHFTDYTTYRTEDTHTHTQDTTLNACYGSHYDWYLKLLSILPPQHWIPPSLHSTVHITPLLPSFTPYIIAWHSHYTHHPALLPIPHRHNHSQLTYLSSYTITHNSTLYIKHTQYTIHYMAF